MSDPDRWRQIQQIFHGARELPPGQRSTFLDSACKSDASVRGEVESLLRSSEEAGNFLESDAERSSKETPTASDIDLWIGKQVGTYKIIERIAFGGMGVVYRGEDLRLRRGAALKFLSFPLQRDPLARERFEREARAASALNHPNICTIYGIGEFEEHPYLAMELLKGQTLGRLIQGKPLPVHRALEFAILITSALESAHNEGIIHRDLKPANIFVTDKGQVKILDFGLAKQMAPGLASSGATETIEEGVEPDVLTSPGMVVGTVSYMSPEQARGEVVDARSDLFSLGAVLYEMTTGQRAFPGRLPVLIIDAILNRPPAAVLEANPLAPAKLEAIITKALEKNRELRYQSAPTCWRPSGNCETN
jgi:eukaryotic-like serine/threonine-protein kinase